MEQVIKVVTDPAFLTFVLVVITGYYAYWTRRVVTATFEIEKLRKKPSLVASVSRSLRVNSVADITLENYGLSPAFKVTIKVKDDFYLWPPNKNGSGGNKFGDLYLVKKGFRVFAPG
ncbi:MAG: hypothetical protein U5L95_01375 [Candidatus Saccharibacteria bacterium]|nr:hypothetical protein [Candidatus Saccharibacteria bacterium]